MSVPILYKLSYNQRKIPKEHIEIWEVGVKDCCGLLPLKTCISLETKA